MRVAPLVRHIHDLHDRLHGCIEEFQEVQFSLQIPVNGVFNGMDRQTYNGRHECRQE